MTVAAGRRRTLLLITSYGLVRKNCDGKLTPKPRQPAIDGELARTIADDVTAVLGVFSGRGTHIASKKLKVSSLRCYNLLVARTPILCITGLFERTPTVFIMGHGREFVLRPEPRWSLHLVTHADD